MPQSKFEFALVVGGSAVSPVVSELIRAGAVLRDCHWSRLQLASSDQPEIDPFTAIAPGLKQFTDPLELIRSTGATLLLYVTSGHHSLAPAGVLEAAVQRGLRTIVIPDESLGADAIYKLIAADEERLGLLVPAFWHRADAACRDLRTRLERGSLGQILHVQAERTVASGPLVQPGLAEAWLLLDADLLQWLVTSQTADPLQHHAASVGLTSPSAAIPINVVSGYHRVTALHSGGSPSGVAVVNVSLAGEGVADTTWTCRAGSSDTLTISITLQHGQAQLTSTGNPPQCQLQINCQNAGPRGESAQTVVEFCEAVATGGNAPACWTDMVRASDIVDGSRRSLRRRRTIELQVTSISERAQFKTQMAAIGCGVLVFTMLSGFATLLVGATCDPRDSAQQRAEAAGFVLPVNPNLKSANPNPSPQVEQFLTSGDLRELQAMAALIPYNPAPVIIATDSLPPSAWELGRYKAAKAALTSAGAALDDTRVLARPLQGRWFKLLLTTCWLVTCLPLAVFLGTQVLLTIAREKRTAAE